MKKIMQTRWEDLVMVNYEVDREWVERFVPEGCELELYEGRALVSVVAFRFRQTKLFGIQMPLFRDFGEINLRIYVRRKEAVHGDVCRGVVFIKEIIPHRLPAWFANVVFRENFSVMAVESSMNADTIVYQWGDEGFENKVKGDLEGNLVDWECDSEEEFIGDNFWAYKSLEGKRKAGSKKTYAFEVSHRPWRMRRLRNVEVGIDIASLYGDDWACHMSKKPSSVFYVDGSEVGVSLPNRLVV